MIFSEQQNLSELIVSHLAYQPQSTIEELREAITPQLKKQKTNRGWYKALRQLLDSEVIVKVKKKYSLNVAWANGMVQFSYLVNANYIDKKSGQRDLINLQKGEKVRFQFPNALAADTFWYHTIALLSARQGHIPYYSYCPHYWFFLAHEFITQKHFEVSAITQSGNYTIVGSRSDIDLWSENRIPNDAHSHHYSSPKPLTDTPEIYPGVVGDFLITFKIQKDLAAKIESLFTKTKFDPKKKNPPKEGLGIYNKKSLSIVVVERNAKKAEKFRRKIARFF